MPGPLKDYNVLNCAAEIKIQPDIQDLADDVSSELGVWVARRKERNDEKDGIYSFLARNVLLRTLLSTTYAP